MNLNTGQWVVIIIAAVLIAGYILGYYYNRQQAEKIFSWLKQGLSTLGEVTQGEKLPGMATGGRLEVNQAAAPLKSVETVYLLAPRENLIFWIFNLLQGRSDELIVWVNYQAKPEQSVEVARRGNRQFEKRLKDPEKPAVVMQESINNLQVAAENKPGSAIISKVRSFLQRYPSQVIRLVVRSERPHLYLRLNLRIMNTVSARDLFAALSDLNK